MKEACGVFGVYAPGRKVANLTFDGLFALQHRGQESAGMAVSDGDTVTVVKDMGLVATVFDERKLSGLQGTWPSATPATRPTAPRTGTAPSRSTGRSGRAGFALGHNGNLTNTAELAEKVGMLPGLDRHRQRRGGRTVGPRLPRDRGAGPARCRPCCP